MSKLLRIAYIDNIGSLKDLLNRDKSFTTHQMNIQPFAIELFKRKSFKQCNVRHFSH